METDGEISTKKAENLVKLHIQAVQTTSPQSVRDPASPNLSMSSSSPQPSQVKLSNPIVDGKRGNDTSINVNASKKRRPLLLQFPFHNQPVALGMHRALALFARWLNCVDPSQLPTTTERPHISPQYLVLAISHLDTLPVVPKTACALSILLADRDERGTKRHVAIVPLLLRVAALEDMKGSFEAPSLDSPSQNEGLRQFRELLAQSSSQPAAVHELVQGTLELLLALQGNISASVGIEELHSLLQDPSPIYLSPASAVCSDLSGGGMGGPWPRLHDEVLSSILKDLLSAQLSSSSAVQRKNFSSFMSEMLLVLFLRHACRLRGVCPSELFPPSK